VPNPTHALDFARFSSDELLDHYRAERDVLRRISPGVPVTTNLMVQAHINGLDYWSWAPELDLVANDHYLDHRLRTSEPHVELAFSADLTRGLAGGDPWLLMETSTSAVNWQPHNVAKAPGQLRRNVFQHVARGSDGALFFQWRASRAGAEKFHSALLPHAGTETKVWREVCGLGADLARLREVAGARTSNDVAIVFDWQAWWATELDSHPSAAVRYLDRPHAHYRALWRAGVGVDFVPPGADLTAYRLVVVPTLYLVDDAGAEAVRRFVEAAAPPWSPTSVASSTSTTMCGSAATPARSATCSACAPRSSSRSCRASACASTTARPPTCGPRRCSSRARGRRVVRRRSARGHAGADSQRLRRRGGVVRRDAPRPERAWSG
jgi:beta-galactosidase